MLIRRPSVCMVPEAGCLQATPNMTCLIVNHENTTWNYYTGRDRAYLLPAAIFRMGGAAVLMSNRCACLKQVNQASYLLQA